MRIDKWHFYGGCNRATSLMCSLAEWLKRPVVERCKHCEVAPFS